MPYVMMPVPEQHVAAVMQFVLRAIEEGSTEPWDAESINTFYDDVDEATRSLLAFVARAAAAGGGELADADAARQIQMTVRETTAIVNELSAVTGDAGHPPLVNVRVVNERKPNGRVVEKRVFQMDPEVAVLIRAAEEAELRDAIDPLGGAPE